jgi:hypothetical protein
VPSCSFHHASLKIEGDWQQEGTNYQQLLFSIILGHPNLPTWFV